MNDGSVALLERETALTVLASLMERARVGYGGALFVVGDAGLGKTSLLGRSSALAQGFAVGRAEGVAAEASLPFGLVSLAWSALGGPHVMEDAVEGDASSARSARFYRSLRWLTEMAATRPVLIALDDLHWADSDSLELLAFLCRRIRGLAVAIVGTARPWPSAASDMIGNLVGSANAEIVELAPLSEAAFASLLSAPLDAPLAPEEATRIWLACGGNPLLMHVVAASLVGRREPLDLGPAWGLRSRLLLARFAGVGEAALGYAQAAAIFGVRFRLGLVGQLAGLTEEKAGDALVRLCKAGLIVDAGPGWASFVHPLFAQVLVEDIAAPLRDHLHGSAFRLLRSLGVDASEAAEHAVAAHLVGDADAVAALERAGLAALAQGALATATIHLSRAVEFAGSEPSPCLLLALADARLTAGDSKGAAELAGGLLVRVGLSSGDRARALNLLVGTAFISGDRLAVEEYLDQALLLAENEGWVVEVLVDHIFVSWVSTQGPRRALAMLERLTRLPPVTDSHRQLYLNAAWGSASLLFGNPDGIKPLRTAAELDLRRPSIMLGDAWSWGPVFSYLNAAKYVEEFDTATRLFEAGFAAAEHAGALAAMGAYTVAHADTLSRMGRLAAASDLLGRVEGIAEFAVPAGPFLAVAAAHLAWEMAHPGNAAAHCDRAEALAPPDPQAVPVLWLWLWHIRAQMDLDAGRVDEACALMVRAAGLARESGVLEPCVVPWAGTAIAAYLAAGRTDDAIAVVEDLEALAAPLPCRWPRAVAASGHARLAERAGEIEEAEFQFARAMDLHAEVSMPLAEAETLISFGNFLRRTGRPSGARQPLALALAKAEKAGALRLAGHAAAALAACGGRRHRRNVYDATLTAQEIRVASLAAEGRTNAEIAATLVVSTKTVEHHLSHVYAKLELTSRRQLMLAWRPPV